MVKQERADRAPQRPRRLQPEARRHQIVEAAARLISQRGDAAISTADVAEAAGVTRALVHHYFHGIDELLDAVVLRLVASVLEIEDAGTEIPVQQRVPRNVRTMLEMVEGNRSVWLAMVTEAGPTESSPGLTSLREALLERMLVNNSDVIEDTAWARLCLGGYLAFSDSILRRWLLGDAPREEVERALADVLLHLLLETIPGR